MQYCGIAASIRPGVHPVCMGGTGFPAGRTMVDSCRLGGVSYPPPQIFAAPVILDAS